MSVGSSQAPTVTVAMPVYNRIPWAVEALQSVLDQTYTDFEVVVVDDGSTEDPAPLQMVDERVRYVRQENQGLAAARNVGLSLARGRYIAFMDADDLLMSDKLEKQVALMERRPDVAISHTSYRLVDHEGKPLKGVPAGRYAGWVYPRIYADAHGIATPTVMVRRDALDEGTRFKECAPDAEDTLFWIGLTKKSELLGIDEPLAEIRMHGKNSILDFRTHAVGLENLVRYGVAQDGDLRASVRRKLLCELYYTLAVMHLERQQKMRTHRFALRALRAWPLDHRVYRFLAALVYRRVARDLARAARVLQLR